MNLYQIFKRNFILSSYLIIAFKSLNKSISLFILLFITAPLIAQENSLISKMNFEGDFRFRIEEDWNSKKSDGSFRDDRTRLRYRVRLGLNYQANDWVSFGTKIRTGAPNKQQDPQLTLGEGYKEFNGLPIVFEKAYAKFDYKWISAWVGKNTFPFEKENELFWSDNVFPEGVALNGMFLFKNNLISSLKINTGHFISNSNGKSLSEDSYFQGLQFVAVLLKNKVKFYPAIYYFNQMPNIPDGNSTYNIDYSILHIGTNVKVVDNPKIEAGLDYYKNFLNLNNNDSIPLNLRNQNKGIVTYVGVGKLKDKGDCLIKLTYTYLEKYAAVDYFAQNDWVRWDYSSQNSPDGRLTNFKGFDIMLGYNISNKMNLILRGFAVNQIIPLGLQKETGDRVRLDFNIKF
jgi:hypothetical protein